ncbi:MULTISPECIES: hypothetical protein [unclassified Oceanispirochaeta]|uniref:hypothetical protein n=1 Tax=unclassified Oceanispirochaeta TaxID=2635722 RepID=UPI0011C06958|nr:MULTISPECIES: hypothetical protein [unclassified Oceanispirochaeta]MBF9015683.1 hypothetical protein [Oceanispirochaeta sp. M2]NPD72148.1 hypothetical protein [Oceanispirochaeta sp. M1]
MSQEETTVYSKCINCGRYAPEANMIVKQFCSEECARQYKRCPHCGNYFMLSEETKHKYCSPQCEDADKIHNPGENT